MRPSAFARMHVVRREDRETRIKQLIQDDIAARKAAGADVFGSSYSLLARSWDSPAARALLATAEDALAMGIQIRILLAQRVASVRSSSTPAQRAAAGEHRLVSDARYLDAHEQLVLGNRIAWIGDCMRRDPTRRDAYECYCDSADRTVLWAARSFECMWAAVDPARSEQTARWTPPAVLLDAPLISAPEVGVSPVALRH